MEVASLKEEEWSYRGGLFNWKENGHVTDVTFNGGSMVMLHWSV